MRIWKTLENTSNLVQKLCAQVQDLFNDLVEIIQYLQNGMRHDRDHPQVFGMQ